MWRPIKESESAYRPERRPNATASNSFIPSKTRKVFGQAVQVELRFARSATKRVLERKWYSTQKFEKLPDGALRMMLKVGLAPDLVSWIASFLNECHVVEPDELRKQIANEAAELARAYGWEVVAKA